MTQHPILSQLTLGLALNDASLAQTLRALDPDAVWEDDDGQADWVSEAQGIDVQADTEGNCVTTVFFYNQAIDGHSRYQHALPHGLSFHWDRAQIGSHLSAPAKAGPKHDCWYFDGYRLVVDYTQDRRRVGLSNCQNPPSREYALCQLGSRCAPEPSPPAPIRHAAAHTTSIFRAAAHATRTCAATSAAREVAGRLTAPQTPSPTVQAHGWGPSVRAVPSSRGRPRTPQSAG